MGAGALTKEVEPTNVERQRWLALTEKALAGASFEDRLVSHTDDAIRIEPLYDRAAGAEENAGLVSHMSMSPQTGVKANGLAARIVRPLHSDNPNPQMGQLSKLDQCSKSAFWSSRILPVFGNRSWFVHAG